MKVEPPNQNETPVALSSSVTQPNTTIQDKHNLRKCPDVFGTNVFQLSSDNKYIEVFKKSPLNDSLVSVFKIEEHVSMIVDYDFIVQNQQLRIVYVTQRGDVIVYQSKDKAMFSFYHIWSTNVKGECLCVSANPYEGCNEEFIVGCSKGNVYHYKYEAKKSEYVKRDISGMFNREEIYHVEWEYVYGWECYFMRVWSKSNGVGLIKVNEDFTPGEANPIDEDMKQLFK